LLASSTPLARKSESNTTDVVGGVRQREWRGSIAHEA
jgi:hypothetical protein